MDIRSKLAAYSSQLLHQTLVRRGGSVNQTSEIKSYVQKLFHHRVAQPVEE